MKKSSPDVRLKGTLQVPGDKSISHRSVMIGSLAKGTTHVSGFLSGADCLSTISCFRKMGIGIEQNGDCVTVTGKGMHGLSAPLSGDVLDCGNSGTTMRLISGILSAQHFSSVLTGDESLCKRPMKRIIDPLSEMGADIRSLSGNGCAPLSITGKNLTGIRFLNPVASAQVKSSVLFAGLYADSETTVIEPFLSRDHTERMLKMFGADVKTRFERKTGSGKDEGRYCITVQPAAELSAAEIKVPGDISSAAYFMAAALMVPGSDILLQNVGINPTRSGILDVLEKMGAEIEVASFHANGGAEPSADLHVCFQTGLHGTEIGGPLIPRLIDEIPIIAALCCTATGTTVIKDAAELKVKESNRIRAMVEGLQKIGADVTETDDGMVINGSGGKLFSAAEIDAKKDHRIAMTFTLLGLVTEEGNIPLSREDADSVRISYPGFFEDLRSLL